MLCALLFCVAENREVPNASRRRRYVMQVTSQELNPCKIELKIEVEPERVAQAFDDMYKEFAKVTKVPGFRPGKAPRAILEKYVTEEAVRREVADVLITEAYSQAIEQEKIEPYAAPEVNMEQLEEGKPLIFKAEVPLPPKVELGDYKGIEVEKPKTEITDEDVDAELTYMQERRTTAEKVEDRGIQENDIAIAETSSTIEGQEPIPPKRSLVQIGQNVAGFDEQIMGLKAGERKTFELTYPEDHENKDVAGKKATFDVSIESIRERIVPELNDEFAKQIGEFETMDQLREDIKQHLITAKEEAAESEVEHKIIDEIINRSQVHVPDVLVNHEVGHDLEDIQKNLDKQGMTIERYLAGVGKTKEDFLKDITEGAEKRVKGGLVMGEVSDKEDIDVTDEEVEAEIERMAEDSKATKDAVEAYIETRGGRTMLKNSMLNKKIMDYLKSVSRIK